MGVDVHPADAGVERKAKAEVTGARKAMNLAGLVRVATG
jgi:hypothetical protein